ncbi:MAG: 2-amino-4-hydroxy-6-hydroxymethyldihydropteridine diphosphokinase [Sulfurimonadaceae bacterium]|jgi:2-amino-4-hydroxy-6-hydroxymethyldihydropteridine diphosphokinase|nr:2-amino-4-hydroxy-6-hydroxymethyldihydropteridine diphosphokinase [Sulfurimonadaceae bacterium]
MYLQRKLSESLTLFKNKNLFCSYKQKSTHRYTTTVGVGGNLGDTKRTIEHLIFFFKRDHRVALLEVSSLLKNPPFGYKDQKDFYNCVIKLQVSMRPIEFLDYLMRVEKRFKRKRSFANAPRTLDLDIIFFNNEIVKKQNLTIPHANWSERESVVIPLSELKS